MKKTWFVGIIASGILISSQAIAFVTFGGYDCGGWINAPSIAQKAWLMGYLSGMNKIVNDLNGHEAKLDTLAQLSSADQAYLWMNNYCKANPLEGLSLGGSTLFLELVTKAKKK